MAVKSSGRHGTTSACAGCGEVFCGVTPFDAHRVGRHGIDRRCLSQREMSAGGFIRCPAGKWSKP